jgi:hypothetical protein
MMRSSSILLACICLAACGADAPAAGRDTGPPGYAQFQEAQRREAAAGAPLTRQQAMAEYRKCIRTMSGRTVPGTKQEMNGSPRACDHWLAKAYPEPRHTLRRDPDSLVIPEAPRMTPQDFEARRIR